MPASLVDEAALPAQRHHSPCAHPLRGVATRPPLSATSSGYFGPIASSLSDSREDEAVAAPALAALVQVERHISRSAWRDDAFLIAAGDGVPVAVAVAVLAVGEQMPDLHGPATALADAFRGCLHGRLPFLFGVPLVAGAYPAEPDVPAAVRPLLDRDLVGVGDLLLGSDGVQDGGFGAVRLVDGPVG